MKKIYLLLITVLLSLTLGVTTVKASNGNEIIPFHPDPSLVTEWDVSEDGDVIDSITFDTPIFKIIIPDGWVNAELFIDTLSRDTPGILWIFSEGNDFIDLEIFFIDSEISTVWLGGGQSEIPTMYISYFRIGDGSQVLDSIYIYPDTSIYLAGINTNDDVRIYSYNFEYELSQEYQLGYNDGYDIGYDDGWGEKNKMPNITILIIGLIIFIIANVLGFIYKNNLLTALSGLLWLLPIFLVDNIFIKIFSIIIMLITFLFSFKERGDYYV